MLNTSGPLLLGAVAALAVLAPTTPATAHPFGPPPQATVAVDGATLTVTWGAEPDDLTALGFATGAFGERQVFTFDDNGQPVDADSAPDQDQMLSDAPEIADYLRAHIRVQQLDTECPPTVVDTEAIIESGALLVYTCPEPITAVELTISTLTDLHPSYRTVGVVQDADDPSLLFTQIEPTQTISFGDQAQPGPLTPLMLGLSAASVVATGAGAAVVLRYRRRTRT